MKKGFSLVELLVSLLIISIIIAAFVPIVTKKAAKSSMTVKVADSKKGLMIYTNPGTYSFDVPEAIDKIYISGAGGGGGGAGARQVAKSATYTSSGTFTVPKGVVSLTFTITGAGGGGGASNGAAVSGSVPDASYLSQSVKLNQCLSSEYLAIRGAISEQDLCITKNNLTYKDTVYKQDSIWSTTLGESASVADDSCWEKEAPAGSFCANYNNGLHVCKYNAAVKVCAYYLKRESGDERGVNTYRLPNEVEAQKIVKYRTDWIRYKGTNGINLCLFNQQVSGNDTIINDGSIAVCQSYGCCPGNVWGCVPYAFWYSDNKAVVWDSLNRIWYGTDSQVGTASVRCVRPISYYKGYSGAGGASGAQLQRTIKVLPNDTLKITIGAGGGSGAQGSTTTVEHRNAAGSLQATYYVKGGLAGNSATTSAHGAVLSTTTPNGTCYANGNVSCSVNSHSGAKGSDSSGGAGGRVNNSGVATEGGKLYVDSARGANLRATTTEISYAKGQDASTVGFGGGGGFTPPWAASTSNFYQGGKGANGKVVITYNVVKGGGGGGAGASAGLNSSGDEQEIVYTIGSSSKRRVVFTVGKGGTGGAVGNNGAQGSNTTFMEDKIIFRGGQGGNIGSGDALGTGGAGGTLSLASGITMSNYTGSNKGAGVKGDDPCAKNGTTTYLSYCIDGGSGGTTFLGYFGGCGGGIVKDSNEQRKCVRSNHAEGEEAKTHNAVDNKYGGQGGGGGGAITSGELGKGANGADGYLRIRWGN